VHAPSVHCRSISSFITEFRRLELPLDLLVNNTGGFFPDPALTRDGFDRTLQVGSTHERVGGSLIRAL
jgi:NAD(P)-dependent dehydrogenase (short-subunit alcohol dehydrogenase family)